MSGRSTLRIFVFFYFLGTKEEIRWIAALGTIEASGASNPRRTVVAGDTI